jgi:hypothetical protein
MHIIFFNLKKISTLDLPNINYKLDEVAGKIKARMEHTRGTGCK